MDIRMVYTVERDDRGEPTGNYPIKANGKVVGNAYRVARSYFGFRPDWEVPAGEAIGAPTMVRLKEIVKDILPDHVIATLPTRDEAV